MGNPETQASVDTRHRMKTNKTKQKHIKLKDAREGLAVPVSYNMLVVSLIVKPGKSPLQKPHTCRKLQTNVHHT